MTREIVLFGLLSILVIGGCGGEDGAVGPSRRATAIYGGTDGVNVAWFVYVDAFGEEIRQEGIRMDLNGGDSAWYFKNNGLGGLTPVRCDEIQYIKSNGITGAGGRCIATGIRDIWDQVFENVYSQMTFTKPDSPGTFAKFKYVTKAKPKTERAFALADKPCDFLPASATIDYQQMAFDETMVDELNGALVATLEVGGWADSWVESEHLIGNYTQAEWDALTNPTINPPSNGIEYTCTLIAQNGRLGNGYCSEVKSLMAVNLVDPNDYLKYSSPFMYSYIVKTAKPIEVIGEVGSGLVKTDVVPDGIEVGLEWYGSNLDRQTHVFRTSWFLPVDSTLSISNEREIAVYDRFTPFSEPNIWNEEQFFITVNSNWLEDCVDPNVLSEPHLYPVPFDPNSLFEDDCACMHRFVNRLDTGSPIFDEIMLQDRVKTAKIVPLRPEGDYIRIQFNEKDLAAISLAIEYWLTDNEIFDRNGDGIVNLKDYTHRE